jgi:hypothetical protein
MLVSKPPSEKRQMSAAADPFAGRARGIGLPAKLQVLLEGPESVHEGLLLGWEPGTGVMVATIEVKARGSWEQKVAE